MTVYQVEVFDEDGDIFIKQTEGDDSELIVISPDQLDLFIVMLRSAAQAAAEE